MAEQPFPVCKQIPDDQDVQCQHDEQADFWMMKQFRTRLVGQVRQSAAEQFKNFYRDEKRRLADRQPDCPWQAERQTQATDGLEQSINKQP